MTRRRGAGTGLNRAAASLLALAPSLATANACTIRKTCRDFADRTVAYQIDGYKHLAYRKILGRYCANLMEELKAKTGSRRAVREALRDIASLDSSDLADKNPFHVVEKLLEIR